MKRIWALLIAVLILLNTSCCVGIAETRTAKAPRPFICLDDYETLRSTSITKYGVQPVYVVTRLLFDNLDGTVSERRITPQVLKITYKYIVHYSEAAGQYTGGEVYLNGTWPKLEVNDRSSVGLNVSCARVTFPQIAYVETTATTYSPVIGGGSFTITYDSVVHYNQQGEITSRESTTVTRSYGFTETGP